jgi:hypothetical protein
MMESQIKNPFALLALISAIPGAYLSFKRSFIKDLQDQMIDLRNPVGIGTGTVRFFYKIFAYIFIGKKEIWMDLFDQFSETHKQLQPDKTTELRMFFWFFLAFVFSFVAWLSN